jgi:hypothetical protein
LLEEEGLDLDAKGFFDEVKRRTIKYSIVEERLICMAWRKIGMLRSLVRSNRRKHIGDG